MKFPCIAAIEKERKNGNKSIFHPFSCMILPLSFREALNRSTTQFTQSKQRLPKLRFLQKLGCQKPCWDFLDLFKFFFLFFGLLCIYFIFSGFSDFNLLTFFLMFLDFFEFLDIFTHVTKRLALKTLINLITFCSLKNVIDDLFCIFLLNFLITSNQSN